MGNKNIIDVRFTSKEGAFSPVYKTEGSSGADVCAFLEDSLVIPPGARELVPTGLFFEIPEGYEIQVRSRSGLALKNGVIVLNSPGTIDSDYRGELKVILANFGAESFTVKNGDRIAQIILAQVSFANFVSSLSISETERGSGGFGSTGV